MELIDVRELVTQILGFLLVLWVLRKFAWPKVLGFIEERRQGIVQDLEHAERERHEASELKTNLDRELKSIEARARSRIQEAVSEGQQIATEIKASAQHDALQRMERAREEIERERMKASEALKNDVVNLAIGTAEKILRQRLDEPTQKRLVQEFIAEA